MQPQIIHSFCVNLKKLFQHWKQSTHFFSLQLAEQYKNTPFNINIWIIFFLKHSTASQQLEFVAEMCNTATEQMNLKKKRTEEEEKKIYWICIVVQEMNAIVTYCKLHHFIKAVFRISHFKSYIFEWIAQKERRNALSDLPLERRCSLML